jgi:hypothetical protein
MTQMEGEGYFTCSNDFYLPSRRLKEGGGGQHPVGHTCRIDQTGEGVVESHSQFHEVIPTLSLNI